MNPRTPEERWQLFDDAARLRSILDASPDAIIAKDLDGTITDWNQAAETIYGWSADEAIGQHIDLIVPEQRRFEVEDLLRRVLAGETTRDLRTTRLHRDGHDIPVVLAVAPLYDRFDRLKGASVVTCHDAGAESRSRVARRLANVLEETAHDQSPDRLRAEVERLRDELRSTEGSR